MGGVSLAEFVIVLILFPLQVLESFGGESCRCGVYVQQREQLFLRCWHVFVFRFCGSSGVHVFGFVS